VGPRGGEYGRRDVRRICGECRPPEPEWPDVGFQRVIDLAFQGRFIRSADHFVIRKLRGEI